MNLDKETRSEIPMHLYYYFWPLNNDRLNPHTNPYVTFVTDVNVLHTTIVTRQLGVPVLTQRRRRRKRERQNTTSLEKQNNNFVRKLRGFFNISLPLLHNYAVNLPIFRFYTGREHKTKTFFSLFWTQFARFPVAGCPSKKNRQFKNLSGPLSRGSS